MSDALEHARGGFNPSETEDRWDEKIGEHYPTLLAAMLGEEDWEKGGGRRPPLSLILTNREGKLKFTLSSQDWPRTYHCQVTDASDVLESVERALKANMGEWVQKRANGSGSGRRG